MPNALVKVNNKAELESELQSHYRKQSETKNQIEQLQKQTYSARREVNRFEMDHQNRYREFLAEDLDEYSRHLYQEKKKAADDLQAELEGLNAELPKIDKDIEEVSAALKEQITVPADEIIAQQKKVSDLTAVANRISEAIQTQQELHKQAKQSREDNAAEIEKQRQELLAKQALGEIEDPQAFKTVAGMADEHYQKSDQEIAQIQSAITGLEKRLNDAQSELENGQKNLHRLEQAFYLDLFTKTVNQYQKKAVDLAKIIDKIHALGRYVDHATFRGNTVSQHGQFSLPSFRGMSCTPNKFLDQNCIDIDAGLKALKSEFKKLGIID